MDSNQPIPSKLGYGQTPRQFSPGGGGSPASAAKTITPKEILDIIRRHVLLIISLTFLGAVAGGGMWFVLRRTMPKYTAQTYIEVLHPGQIDPTVIGTPLANKDIAYEFRFSKAALIKQQSMLQELIRRDAIRETRWFKKFNNDIVKIIKDLEDNLITSAGRNSSYISVRMTCGNPKEAALIVNEMVDLFIRSQQTTAEADVGQKLRELTQQENEYRNKLQSLTSSLADIRRSTGLTQLEGDDGGNFRHTITQKLSKLEIEKMELEADIEQLRTSVANYEEREITDDIVQRDTENDTVIMGFIQRIASLETELARKTTTLGENHREVLQLRELLRQTIAEKDARNEVKARQIRDSDISSVKDRYTMLTNRYAKLEELRAQTESEQRELDNTRAAYDQRVEDREETRNKLFTIQEQISKYNLIKQDAEAGKVKQVGLAPEPLEVSWPKLLVFAPGGTFLGCMLGIGLAFLIELLNDLLRTPNDVVKFVQVPLLGMITHKDLDDSTRNVDMWQVVRQSPFSMISECYRKFRANLTLSANIDAQRVIFVTSGNAGEGRTTVATNIATTFAAEGKKILLIDANFRRPSLYKAYPNPEGPSDVVKRDDKGLSTYLVGDYTIAEIIRPTGFDGTDVIDSGTLPANPAELLGSQAMTELIQYVKGRYDRVIIDGPPILVSDAKAIASQADGTVLVFNAAITRRGAARRIVRELKEINTNILGAVLIGVRVLKGGYFRELFDSYKDYQNAQKEKKAGRSKAKAKAEVS
ncbi:MAG: polysaccharide biosynthesis tyrosine autokinase [Sedimentisphaerales bacterium]|nr:polysaccharide biosynthesis tyrosine autokinase [Sedimentisphaerales bacterium]